MTKLTAKASAPTLLPSDATLFYARTMQFNTTPQGGLSADDSFDRQWLRFLISDDEKTAVRVDRDGNYFYRDGWSVWTHAVDAKTNKELCKAFRALAKLPVDDLPLELGVQHPLAVAMALSPLKGVAHPLTNSPAWTEDQAIEHYFKRLSKKQTEALQGLIFHEKNVLDWALLQRQMKIAEHLWETGMRPSIESLKKGLPLWALSGGYDFTPSIDIINARYEDTGVSMENREWKAALHAKTKNSDQIRIPSFTATWEVLERLWLERLSELPLNSAEALKFFTVPTGDEQSQEVIRTPFHHRLAVHQLSEPLQLAWVEAMNRLDYPFEGSHEDPILGIQGEDGLVDLARRAGFEDAPLRLLREQVLKNRLPLSRPASPKPRF